MAVDQAGHTVVAATEQGESIFHGPEYAVGHVLPLLCALAKPAVVGEVDEKVIVILCRITRAAGEGVFKTN